MSVDVSQYTTPIKTAVAARTVRDNIAGGIDAVANEMNNYEAQLSADNDQFKDDIGTRQTSLETKQTNLENTFNQEIANQTVANPSNAETVAARTDNVNNKIYDTIGKRLDDHSSQLADKTNQINDINNNKLPLKANQTDLDTTNSNVANNTSAIALKADKSEVTNVMTPKGNSAYGSLPTSGNTIGWYYYCSDGDGIHGAGNYVWNGTAWYFGGTGDEGYNILNGEIANLYSLIKTGKNIFDATKITTGYYIGGGGVPTASATLFYSDLIPITPNANYCYSVKSGLGDYFAISLYDSNKKYISNQNIQVTDFTSDTSVIRKYIVRQYNAYYIRVSTATADYANNLMITQGNDYAFEPYYWYFNDDTREQLLNYLNNKQELNVSAYTLPFIQNGKLCCNGSNGSITAYYAGVDCGSKINAVWANFVFEADGVNNGDAAIIINPNGVDKITNITDLSLHCQVMPTRLKVDILGNKYGSYYYQNLIDITFTTPLACDGTTEHKVIISAESLNNNVYVTVNGTQYTGSFTPTADIANISDVLGQYVTIEHFANTAGVSTKMPRYTFVQARDVNNNYVLRDYFDRQNGVIQNAPTGQPYHLINNQLYNR